MQVEQIHRYPVKGLSPEPLDGVTLQPGAYFPGDRVLAVEHGPSGFDPDHPQHQPKIKFLQLMRHEKLARVRSLYDDAGGTLRLEAPGQPALTANVSTPTGRAAVEAFLTDYMGNDRRGPLKVLGAPEGFRFTDSRSGYVSVLNAGSILAIEEAAGRPVDPRRFRANILVSGPEPFAELGWVGRRLRAASGLTLEITKRTVRCAAVNVDPTTGARDMDIPRLLMRELGHMDCGVYARIVHGGSLRRGHDLDLLPADQMSLPLGG